MSRSMWTRLWVICLTILLTGCSTFSQTMDRIKPGMDKDEVLSRLGNPKRTFRENGVDNWIYLYYQDDQEYRRDVVFANGKVIRVTRATLTRKSSFHLELENSNSPEEFEAIVRAQQKKKSQFKYIDGLPAEAPEKSP